MLAPPASAVRENNVKILMLVNWKIEYGTEKPMDKQPPDYVVEGEPYWFYRYFKDDPQVDVIDISSFPLWEAFEKKVCRFYIWQAIKAIFRARHYDLIVSHGMQSGIVLSFWRRLFGTRAKHVVFDIGSFNSAAEKGLILKIEQFASKAIDGLIYHTSSQQTYYEKFFPWLVERSKFMRFGTDLDFFDPVQLRPAEDRDEYIVCVGYSKRDWDTVIKAYQQLKTDKKLRFIGHIEEKYRDISGVEQYAFMPIQDLMNQIHNASFSVLPLKSFNYSYGQMTLMQQMALGKCVIAARVPSLIDYIEDGETAVMYEPENASDLAEKMANLIRDPMRGQVIASQGQIYLQNHCNEEIMAREIEDYFKLVKDC